jgi:hypothetical protein
LALLAHAPADSLAVPASIRASTSTVLAATITVHRTRNPTKEALIALSPLSENGLNIGAAHPNYL